MIRRQDEVLASEAEYYQAEREVIAAARAVVAGTSPWELMARLRTAVDKLNAMRAAAAG